MHECIIKNIYGFVASPGLERPQAQQRSIVSINLGFSLSGNTVHYYRKTNTGREGGRRREGRKVTLDQVRL